MTSAETEHHRPPESFTSFHEINTHLTQLHERLAPAYEAFNEVVSGNPEILDEVDEAMAIQLTKEKAARLSNPEIDQLRLTVLYNLLDEATQQRLKPSITQLSAGFAECAALEPHAEALGAEEFKTRKETLANTIDWEILVKNAVNHYDSTAHNVLSRLGTKPTSYWTYGNFAHALGEMNDLQTELEAKDLIGEDMSELEEDPEYPLNPDLTETIHKWQIQTQATFEYLSDSRREAANIAMPYRKFSQLINLRAACKESWLGFKPPLSLLYTLQDETAATFEEFDEADLDRLSADLGERPNGLFIGNQRLLQETTNIDDVPTWVNERLSEFPDWYSAGIGFINFSDDDKRRIDKEGKVFSSLGHMVSTENTLLIYTQFADYKALLAENTASDSELRASFQESITETFDHELTHYAHLNRIPIAWLRQWTAVTEHETVYVTSYVESISQPDHPKHYNRKLEDLAESTTLFMTKPAELLLAAPLRFAALNRRDGRYPNSAIIEAVDFIKKNASSRYRAIEGATGILLQLRVKH